MDYNELHLFRLGSEETGLSEKREGCHRIVNVGGYKSDPGTKAVLKLNSEEVSRIDRCRLVKAINDRV